MNEFSNKCEDPLTTFVINLDTATERWEHYKDKGCKRWSATSYDEISVNSLDIKRLISYHNLSMKEHLCKLACLKSHMNLWRYITQNQMNNILVLEDDADLVRPVPPTYKFRKDGITYLGGYTSHVHVTKGAKKIDLPEGIHIINHNEYRVLMTMAYFIPNWKVAEKLLNNMEYAERWRCIDIMMRDFTGLTQSISYPASFKERPTQSQIKKKKRSKFANEFYEMVKV